jgi:cell division protein FtsL
VLKFIKKFNGNYRKFVHNKAKKKRNCKNNREKEQKSIKIMEKNIAKQCKIEKVFPTTAEVYWMKR